MDMELARPGALPGLHDLNSLAKSAGHEIVQDMFAALENGDDITDYDTEEDDDNTMSYIDLLRGFFFPHAHPEEVNASLTTYRAMGFAANVAEILLLENAHTDYDHIPRHLQESALVDNITRQAQEYLSERTALDNIISNFVSHVSPESSYTRQARLIIGFQLIAIDRWLQARHVEEQAAQYSEQLSNWDGIVGPSPAN